MPKTDAQHANDLTRLAPAAAAAKLGYLINELVNAVNALGADLAQVRTKVNGTLTKMDSDAGITDTNYNALGAIPAATVQTVKLPSQR